MIAHILCFLAGILVGVVGIFFVAVSEVDKWKE